jgi:xanthine dehydrogenase accessory factor
MVNNHAEIDRLLAAGENVVVARIVRQTGSAPRTVGTTMLMRADGSIAGTIGGGALEFQVIQKAREVIGTGAAEILNFRLSGKEVAASEMLCGGLVDVHIERITPADPLARSVFAAAARLVAQGRRGTLVTPVTPGAAGAGAAGRLLVAEDGPVSGALAGGAMDMQRWRRIRRPVLVPLDELAGGGPLVFAEPVEPEAVVYVFGAGHISTFLTPLARLAGFRVCVIDDRAEFANPERFPDADEILTCSFSEAFHRLRITPTAYVAIVTRGHIHDRDVLRMALETEPAYIGMIGSLRKRDMIYRALAGEGVGEEKLRKVHSPIGLDIGAETPEEIAVSIVAELIAVRARASAAGRPPATVAPTGSP